MEFPNRYEPLSQLGGGGGGQVWSVRDRLSGQTLAIKVLREGATEPEALALVHEATVLSGLEGLGLPRVLAFGKIATGKDGIGRHFMVRELVSGESLETLLEEGEAHSKWLGPLLEAGEQLAAVHRTGMLHGDIKPANIVVTDAGRGTLVDLGLAAPLASAGVDARGLTPRFAAPELLRGDPLTVRAEVFSFGATLGEALARAGDSFDDDTRLELARVVLRAKDEDPQRRFPSIDEVLQAMYTAVSLTPDHTAIDKRRIVGWPILGIDACCTELVDLVTAKGARVALVGPPGSGRTALARRAAFTLGVRGFDVLAIEPGAKSDAFEASLGGLERDRASVASTILVVDDYDLLPAALRERVEAFAKKGYRVLMTGEPALGTMVSGASSFEIPKLSEDNALDLVRRSSPSLAEPLARAVAERADFRPGILRSLLEGLRGRVVVTRDDLFIDGKSEGTPRARLAHAISTGRFAEAEALVKAFEPTSEDERLDVELARVRVALARGDNALAFDVLKAVETLAAKHGKKRLYDLLLARTFLRRGEFQEARTRAADVLTGARDELFADALSVQGIAHSYLGEHEAALALLESAALEGAKSYSQRGLGVLWGSLAIVHQRMGKNDAAREAYVSALTAAEAANDAWNVATTRLNLAGIERQRGDLARAIDHLEAAIEMGERAGASLCVLQARLNLANLDLYLGRLAHARGLIDAIARQGQALSDDARLQLAGLDAEYAERSGNLTQAADRYEACAKEYEKNGRVHEAEEAFLASVLARAESNQAKTSAHELLAVLRKERSAHRHKGKTEAREHDAIAQLAEGVLHLSLLDEALAKRALDAALTSARAAGRSEWIWQALEARARLADMQGASQLARRDREEATAILEETAVKLPKDLREVFWNDPKRRALRAHSLAEGPQKSELSIGRSFGSVTSAFGKAGGVTLSTMFLRDERLAKIFEITRDLAREQDLARLLGLVTDHAMSLVGAERGFIVLVAEDGSFETQSARGVTNEADREFSRSVAERVVRTAEPIATTSAQEDARLQGAVSVHQRMLQSIACVPIRGAPPHGNPIGALYLETQNRAEQRFQAELPMLMAFADQAAIAIENARLLAQNRARAEELAAANEELREAKDRLAELLGRRTEQLAATRRDLRQVRAEIRSHFGYAGLVGASAAMRRMYAIVDRVKDTDIPVLITGESGTGKEVVAKAIHSSGARSRAVFLGVNCGAIPANLLESELFGHVRGAFTGADHERKGLFREASSGTLLLDEVGELPLSMQASLLRVLQERTVRPVGGNREEPIGTRVIAATNRDLEAMVAEGTFREDLYYRLNVVEIPVPALRERQEDVPLLIDHFLSLFASRYRRERKSIDRTALRVLSEHDWPGNVRQLEHVLLNAWLMGEGDEIQIEDFPQSFTRKPHDSELRRVDSAATPGGSKDKTRDVKSPGEFRDSEKERILAALARCQWNRVQAAKVVGLPRRTFYRRLKEYGILE